LAVAPAGDATNSAFERPHKVGDFLLSVVQHSEGARSVVSATLPIATFAIFHHIKHLLPLLVQHLISVRLFPRSDGFEEFDLLFDNESVALQQVFQSGRAVSRDTAFRGLPRPINGRTHSVRQSKSDSKMG